MVGGKHVRAGLAPGPTGGAAEPHALTNVLDKHRTMTATRPLFSSPSLLHVMPWPSWYEALKAYWLISYSPRNSAQPGTSSSQMTHQ